jgi:hypothetical protein
MSATEKEKTVRVEKHSAIPALPHIWRKLDTVRSLFPIFGSLWCPKEEEKKRKEWIKYLNLKLIHCIDSEGGGEVYGIHKRNLDPRCAPHSPDDDPVSGEVDPCCESASSAQHGYGS